MTSESLPRRTERKRSTLLPPYSLHPPIASIKNAAALVTQLLPVRAFSTDSEATLDPSPILTSTGRIIGDLPIPITEEPEDSTSGLPPPPHYFGSTKPVLLWLDGGGTKIMIEAYFLGNILRRLAWDLKYINSRSSTPQYEIPPKDCFDWVGGSGCGTIIAFMVAGSMTATEMQEGIKYIAPALRNGDIQEIERMLEEMVVTNGEGDETASDSPIQTNVWLPTEHIGRESPGTCLHKGAYLKRDLLPIVLREIQKELNGTLEALDCTERFLHDVCPVFSDCSFMLSLGSGYVPPYQQQTWWQWVWGENKPPVHPLLPDSRNLAKSNIIPPDAYSLSNGTFIRLQPDLYIYQGADMRRLDDWTTDFTEFRGQFSNYLSKAEPTEKIERATYMLRWKDIPAPPLRIGSRVISAIDRINVSEI